MISPIGNWTRRCPLNIQQSQVNGDITNFPVLITEGGCLPTEMLTSGGVYAAKSDGGDIRFSSDISGTNELPFEIVSFRLNTNPASADAQIWVRVPFISGAVDTTIYVWYANSAASGYSVSSTFGRNNVWYPEYKSVWHCNSDLIDSTSGNLTGVRHGSNDVIGKIGGGQSFTINADRVALPGLEQFASTSGAMAIWALSNRTGIGTPPRRYIFARNSGNTHFYGDVMLHWDDSDNKIRIQVVSGGNGTTGAGAVAHVARANSTGGKTNWTRYVGIWNPTEVALYVNGVKQSNVATGSVLSANNQNVSYCLAQRCNGSIVNAENWDGKLDEAMLMTDSRNSDWWAAEYANQNSPTTFTIAQTPDFPVPPNIGLRISEFEFHYDGTTPILCWSVIGANTSDRVMNISPSYANISAASIDISATSACAIVTGTLSPLYTLFVSISGGTIFDSATVYTFDLTTGLNFSAAPVEGSQPLCVEFTDTSTYPSSNYVTSTRTWNFGDGTSATTTERNICHRYEGGFDETFNVTLDVDVYEEIMKLSFDTSGISALGETTNSRNYEWRDSSNTASNVFIDYMIPDGGHSLIVASGTTGTGYFSLNDVNGIGLMADMGIGSGISALNLKELNFMFVGAFPSINISAYSEILHVQTTNKRVVWSVSANGMMGFRWTSLSADRMWVTAPGTIIGMDPNNVNQSLSEQTLIVHLNSTGTSAQFFHGAITADMSEVNLLSVSGFGDSQPSTNIIAHNSDIILGHILISSGHMDLAHATLFHNSFRGIS